MYGRTQALSVSLNFFFKMPCAPTLTALSILAIADFSSKWCILKTLSRSHALTRTRARLSAAGHRIYFPQFNNNIKVNVFILLCTVSNITRPKWRQTKQKARETVQNWVLHSTHLPLGPDPHKAVFWLPFVTYPHWQRTAETRVLLLLPTKLASTKNMLS